MGPFLKYLVDWIKAEWVGAEKVIDTALANGISEAQLEQAIKQAVRDYKAGDNFGQILTDIIDALVTTPVPTPPAGP